MCGKKMVGYSLEAAIRRAAAVSRVDEEGNIVIFDLSARKNLPEEPRPSTNSIDMCHENYQIHIRLKQIGLVLC